MYQELNNDSIKKFLIRIAKKKYRVLLLLDRTSELVSIIYNLFCNEITFVPVDPRLPAERICYILEDSRSDIVISQSKYKYLIGDRRAFLIDESVDLKEIDFEYVVSQNDLAYVIYTSGSTGVPKGVEITREAVFNFIEGISEIIDFSAGKRIACFTTVSFDIFFLESIMALYKGLTVILSNEEEQNNPKLMARLIQEKSVDMIQMTPSRMQLLLNYDKELSCLEKVKEIMIGGEPFPLSLLRKLQDKTTSEIYNMYGPTETTIWSTVSDLTRKERIDIGRPIKNTEIYIVDEGLSIVQNGFAGELCIAGKGLAKGYVGKEELTAEKFINLPQKHGTRAYRTGDKGRYLPDGELEYLGRLDNQVKIRGHRIELEEIEAHLNQFDGIRQSIVVALNTVENDKILEAFYTSDINLSQKAISDYLLLNLPDYMLPVIYKRVEKFKHTKNGKIDRKRVFECVEVNDDFLTNESIDGKLKDFQKRVYEVIASNFDINITNKVTLETNFKNLGIDSITFVKIIISLETEFGFEFDDEKLLFSEFPTIKSLLDYVTTIV